MEKITDITESESIRNVPESIFKQINEISEGGFFLITFGKDGTPVIHEKWDSPLQGLAVERVLQMYIDRKDAVGQENFSGGLTELDRED